jgi:hypothetical protein
MIFSGKGSIQGTDMNRRLLRILIISIPLLLLVIYLMKERSPFGGSNSSFAVGPDMNITRIEFTQEGSGLTLEKKGDDWLVDNKYETRKSSVVFILRILTGLEIKSPVTPELFRSEIISGNIKPVKVRVFSGRKLLKSYLVYKTNSNRYGNIMKIKEGSKPFIVYLPGTETNIGSAFNMHELFWQPFVVFSLMPSQISSVSFENLRDTLSSFGIIRDDGKFTLTDLKHKLTGWDTSRINRYITYFTHIPFESWAFELPEADQVRIRSEDPIYRITVVTSENKTIGLKLWQRNISEGGILKPDTDRLWAKTQESDGLFIMKYIDIDPILKKRSYFYPD